MKFACQNQNSTNSFFSYTIWISSKQKQKLSQEKKAKMMIFSRNLIMIGLYINWDRRLVKKVEMMIDFQLIT